MSLTTEEIPAFIGRATMLTRHLRDVCERVEDHTQRASDDTDGSLFHELGLLNHMADTSVLFAVSWQARERHPEFAALVSELQRASRHWHRIYPTIHASAA